MILVSLSNLVTKLIVITTFLNNKSKVAFCFYIKFHPIFSIIALKSAYSLKVFFVIV